MMKKLKKWLVLGLAIPLLAIPATMLGGCIDTDETLPTPGGSVTLLGDVNNDGVLNRYDFQAMMNVLGQGRQSDGTWVGANGICAQGMRNADINNDGVIDMVDLAWMLEKMAEIYYDDRQTFIDFIQGSFNPWG